MKKTIKKTINKNILKFNLYYIIIFIIHILFNEKNNFISIIDLFLFISLIGISIILFKKLEKTFRTLFALIIDTIILLILLFSYLIFESYIITCNSGFCELYYIISFLLFAIIPILILDLVFFIVILIKKLKSSEGVE